MFVTKNVYQLSSIRGLGVSGSNVFLLLDNSITLIDTGLRGRSASILNEVKRLGYKPSDIAHIILTHHHADHAGSLAELKNATGAKVMAHPADAPYINGDSTPARASEAKMASQNAIYLQQHVGYQADEGGQIVK